MLAVPEPGLILAALVSQLCAAQELLLQLCLICMQPLRALLQQGVLLADLHILLPQLLAVSPQQLRT